MAYPYKPLKPVEETTLSLLERQFCIMSSSGQIYRAIHTMKLLLSMMLSLKEFRENPEINNALKAIDASPEELGVVGSLFTVKRTVTAIKFNACLDAWKQYHNLKQRLGLGIKTRPAETGDDADVCVD